MCQMACRLPNYIFLQDPALTSALQSKNASARRYYMDLGQEDKLATT